MDGSVSSDTYRSIEAYMCGYDIWMDSFVDGGRTHLFVQHGVQNYTLLLRSL